MLFLAGSLAWGDDKKDNAAPDGSHAITYKVKIQEFITGSTTNSEKEWDFKVEAFDVPGDRLPRRKIFVPSVDEDASGPSLPLIAMQYRPRDTNPSPEIADMTQRGVNEAFWRLVQGSSAVPAKRLDQAGSGVDRIKVLGVPLGRNKVVVDYTLIDKSERNGNVEYKVSLKQPFTNRMGSAEVTLDEYVERWIFKKDTKEFLGAQWRSKFTRVTGGNDQTRELRIEAIQQDTRPLTRDEVTSVKEEFELLLPVVRSLQPGFTSSADKDVVLANWKKYQQGYGEGVLSGALDPLSALIAAKAPEIGELPDPDKKAATLMNKEAPTFKLSMLSGGEFDLAKHKGKVVAIQFWSLM